MRSIALLPLLALAACVQNEGSYPSLLPRPVETQSLAEPQRVPIVATPDPALDRQIAELTATLTAASARFSSAAQAAEAKVAVARGVREGSEAWLDAQAALSELAALRAPIVNTLAELERLATERGTAGQPPYPALDAAVESAVRLSNAQEDRADALEAALAGA